MQKAIENNSLKSIPLVTHMVTEITPDEPGTRVVSPLTMPTRAKSLIEAEKFIKEWVDENLETVKYRHETAGRVFNESEMPATIAHYCSVYAGTNEASRERLMKNPVQHFSDGLFKYLKNQTQFDRKSEERKQTRSTTTNFGSDESKFQQPQIF